MSKWTTTILWLICYVFGCYMAYLAGRTNGMVEGETRQWSTYQLLLDASADICKDAIVDMGVECIHQQKIMFEATTTVCAEFINDHCVCETRRQEEER